MLSKGAARCLVCDLERNSFMFIPTALYKILLEKKEGFIIPEVVDHYSNGNEQNRKTIMSYFDRLLKVELLTFTNFPEYYIPISTSWDYPGDISNAIIDIDKSTGTVVPFLDQATRMGCRYAQLRFFSKLSIPALKGIVAQLETSIIESIEIFAPYETDAMLKGLIKLMQSSYRIRSFSLYNAPENAIKYSRSVGFGHIVTVTTDVKGHLSCGFISHDYFTTNISTYTESLAHNSCLNRKISIDVDGNIKNCPSMPQSFGNIKDTTLQEALDHPDFKKYWNVTKDQISVCKDCEFRYICTDCRGYIENPEDMYSKPLKCGYNPHTCEWEEWSTNPLKQRAIDYYGMREVLPEFKMKPDYAPATSPSTA
ncbi:MAG: grasp-with-spasm system SPASM domain peptide maturase [Saprospiraceae bacterium]|nr:grasp-with-spasm system SPASM domain peptide maturase [Saprospiraceae bacterium]